MAGFNRAREARVPQNAFRGGRRIVHEFRASQKPIYGSLMDFRNVFSDLEWVVYGKEYDLLHSLTRHHQSSGSNFHKTGAGKLLYGTGTRMCMLSS